MEERSAISLPLFSFLQHYASGILKSHMDPQQPQSEPVLNQPPTPPPLPTAPFAENPQPTQPPVAPVPALALVTPAPTPTPTPEPTAPIAEIPAPDPQPAEPEQGEQTPVEADTAAQADSDDPVREATVITWEASESVHHEKDMLWFGGLAAGALVLTAISIFVIKLWTFTILIPLMTVSLIIIAMRPPRVLNYQLSDTGWTIGEKQYAHTEFQAFGIVQDGPFFYLSLIPVRRFMPSVNVYFPEKYGEEIVDVLGAHLPLRTMKPDLLDLVIKRLRL